MDGARGTWRAKLQTAFSQAEQHEQRASFEMLDEDLESMKNRLNALKMERNNPSGMNSMEARSLPASLDQLHAEEEWRVSIEASRYSMCWLSWDISLDVFTISNYAEKTPLHSPALWRFRSHSQGETFSCLPGLWWYGFQTFMLWTIKMCVLPVLLRLALNLQQVR